MLLSLCLGTSWTQQPFSELYMKGKHTQDSYIRRDLHTVPVDTFSFLNSFLDKAAVILWNEHDGSRNPWRLCTVTQVEELKILLRMFPIWATGIVFFTVCAQNSSMFIEQGMALDNQIGSFKIPAATLSSLDVISIVVWVPIYERIVVLCP